MAIELQYPLGEYSSSNKPSNLNLMGDLSMIQTAVNAQEEDIANTYTKAEIDALILATKQALYPVGSYYSNGAVSTNPATLLGFGTWVAVDGKVIVGLDAGQTEFDTLLKTGGEKTHLLTGAESGLAAHNHTQNAHGHSDSGHNHTLTMTNRDTNAGISGYGPGSGVSPTTSTGYANIQNTTATNNAVANTNAVSAHNNLQPYEVAAMWRRTA